MREPLFVGIDLGTSGCRAIAIDGSALEVAEGRAALPAPRRLPDGGVEQDAQEWWEALAAALDALLSQIPRERVRALAVDGTSGSVLVTDPHGRPLAPALLYDDNRAVAEAERIRAVAPRESAAHGTSSGLAKLIWLLERQPRAARFQTPAGWLSARLSGLLGLSDANNVMKLGWDPVRGEWPGWVADCVKGLELPAVVAPGSPIGPLSPAASRRFALPADTLVVAGTTDSTAALIATGAGEVGDAVTSLGSTLVMKVITDRPLFAPEYGVYSQPYGGRWLAGGGSNSGGAVLRRYFSDAELARLEPLLCPECPTGLDYYPLPAPGERFPINDPRLAPRLDPRPADDRLFLQGLLEGMARIEAEGYRRLRELGAPYPTRVLSAGGGAGNSAWRALRERSLGVPVLLAQRSEAAYGSALLARRGGSGRGEKLQ